jgi:uncharacterized protein
MYQRDEYPIGVPCWVDIAQADPEKAADFYHELFDWTVEDRLPPGSGDHYFIASVDGLDVAAIGSRPPRDTAEPIWTTYVRVDSADAAAERVRGAGGEVKMAPTDVGPAGRMATCADPCGAVFHVWEPRQRAGAQLVNAPGSWNFSELHTPDPSGSIQFYGTVFGWEARTIEFKDFQATMWCVPGYGDFLSARDPETRERHESDPAMKSFGDAVAWLEPADDANAPAVWTVTFAVDDPDRCAARAAELGGSVIAEPVDQPPVRRAVLRDPYGAAFAVSSYRPDA